MSLTHGVTGGGYSSASRTRNSFFRSSTGASILVLTALLSACGRGVPAGVNLAPQTDGTADDGDPTTTPSPGQYNGPTGGRAVDGQTFAFSGPPAYNDLSGGAYGIPGAHTISKVVARSNNKATSRFDVTGLLASFFPKVITYTIDTPVAAYCSGGGGEVFGTAKLSDAKTGGIIDSFTYSYKFGPDPANPTTQCQVVRTVPGTNTTSTIPDGGMYRGHETGQFKGLPAGTYEFLFEMNLKSEPDGKTTLSATSTITAR